MTRDDFVGESKIGEEKLKEIIRDAMNESKPQKINFTCSAEQPESWRDLQTKVKEIYSNLGCQAQENVIVGGGKAKHQIDVLATFEFGGQNYRIIIECKYWSSKVKKSQVSSLIAILADIGAEKGVIVTKMGFQRGAHSLAAYTNIELLTYDELQQKAELSVEEFRIQDALGRIESLRRPFAKFLSSMAEEAEKIDEWWYPSTEGYNLLGALSIMEHKIKSLDQLSFPRRFLFSSISQEKEVSKTASSRKAYLDLVLENLQIVEKEFEELKDKIFSE
jgi:hypothetical protein